MKVLANAAIVGAVVLVASLFGNFTRPVGHLSAFWPANALLLGLMVRNPAFASPAAWLAAFAAYVAGDLLTGSTLLLTTLLTTANLAGVAAGYVFYRRLHEDDRRLRRPLSVLYLVLAASLASAAAAVVGAIVHPLLFDGSVIDGWIFWFVSEIVNYVALLPVILTLPSLKPAAGRPRFEILRPSLVQLAPALALVLSCLASLIIAGPGAVAFPVLALLWCALAYELFATAVLTLIFSVWTLLALSTGHLELSLDDNAWPTLMSVRIGVTLMALAPITVASITAARNDLLARLQHMASHDQLTGVLNRHAFTNRAGAALARLAISKQPAAVLMLDIDNFKGINDTYGHAAGDQVLIAFAKLVPGYLRDSDVFGRLGGEEFAILLSECGEEEARAIAERIRAVFAETPFELDDGRGISATVSIGATFARRTFAGLEPLLRAADDALYGAKKAGRNRIEAGEFGEPATAKGRSGTLQGDVPDQMRDPGADGGDIGKRRAG